MRKAIAMLLVVVALAGCTTANLEELLSQIPAPTEPAIPEVVIPATVPAWNACTKASCWIGDNAQGRNMNILSPNCPEQVFKDRVKWQLDRGCNTVHLFVANKGDGEFAGYCIYGNAWDWSVDTKTVSTFNERIAYCRSKGLAVVLWLFADDSKDWNATASKDFKRYANDLATSGLFKQASTVVVGLELPEYFSVSQARSLVACIRPVYAGAIGTHATSGNLDYASLGDIVFYQVSPGKSAAWIKAETGRVIVSTGKPVNFFELSRHEDRALSQAALDGGAFGVANW